MSSPAGANGIGPQDAFDRPHVGPGASGTRPGDARLWLVQLLRAVAAVMVVIGHSQSAVEHIALAQGRPFQRWHALPWGAGVDLFFVISGFIMVYASRRLFGRPGARAEFVSHRLARVVPLYWCATTLTLAILLLAAWKGGDPVPGAARILGSYLFVPVRAPGGGIFPIFDLGWTLEYEIAFYALFALFVGTTMPRAAVAVFGSVVVVALIGSVVRFGPAPLYFWTRPIVVDFGLGVLLGLASARGAALAPALRVALIAAGGALFCLDPGHLFAGPLGVTVANGWPRVLLAGVPAVLVMAGALLGPQPALPRWLRLPIAIGNASYSLYLVHPFVLIAVEKLVQKVPAVAGVPLVSLVALAVAAAIGAALLVFRWVEQPLARYADHALRNGRDAWRRRADVSASAGR